MATEKTSSSPPELARRRFLAGSTAALAAGAFPNGVHAQAEGSEDLKIALIGCGGRGTGAAAQALEADDRAKLWAMADIDSDSLDRSRETLEKGGKISRSPEGASYAGRVEVPPERQLIGLDAFQRVMDRDDIDVVILTTPPGFRPYHFEAAIKAGKHVFMEKPVAVDGPGVRRVIAAAREAKDKNLKVGVGLNRRHSSLHEEAISRIHDGAVGDIHTIRLYNCRPGVGKYHKRDPKETELMYQVKHWYYFTWLSGDFPVEQSVHDYDVVRWIMQEKNPVSCQGQGGRLVRNADDYGQIYDHFYMEYDYADGTKLHAQHRHIPKCWIRFGEDVVGSKGTMSLISKQRAELRMRGAAKLSWRQMEEGNSYQTEHDRLFKAIREDLPFNEAERGAESTLASIMGRMAAYSGQAVTWEEAMNSEENLVPNVQSWDDTPPILPDENGRYPVPKPGAPA